ncbi:zinc finger BED domain-containing protein 4-like [Melanotaenia boesemani]|uniref:zinc finger BED domain-containing protein 4-like n=1 Tax=Melanotaenia boesemani TaxID=1250792 RepID=UPI001C0570D2|nr:zinc finger BED domain-containing protein 4-like [Melanotaenia boesemani]
MSWVCWMEIAVLWCLLDCLICFALLPLMDRSRKLSQVWNHFDLLTPNKVKCRLCSTELSYINKSTSSMLRHYRARHGNEELADTPAVSTPVPNKQALDEAVINMIIKDCQPLTLVENEGFRELMQLVAPSYVLPSRKTVKNLVDQKYEEEKNKIKKDLQSAVAV